jgi:hypothetical protein
MVNTYVTAMHNSRSNKQQDEPSRRKLFAAKLVADGATLRARSSA